MPAFEKRLLDLAGRREPELLQQINRTGSLPDETREALTAVIYSHATDWSERRADR
jgi:molybdenum-dependent DNA-binding transcriptional regulator ModE